LKIKIANQFLSILKISNDIKDTIFGSEKVHGKINVCTIRDLKFFIELVRVSRSAKITPKFFQLKEEFLISLGNDKDPAKREPMRFVELLEQILNLINLEATGK
jgi:hypothetical protein